MVKTPSRSSRFVTVGGIALATLVSAVAVLAATGYQRPAPPAEPAMPGLTVQDGKVTLTPEAPQWRLIKLGKAEPAIAHWTDPVPARVKIDETRASKAGSPLRGRILSVFVELGQEVTAGTPLFEVASPGIAELRAQHDKARVELEAAKMALERIKAMVAARALPAKEEMLATQQFREAEVEARLAEAKLSSLKVSAHAENEFTVTAQRDGVVVEKNVLQGQEVSPDAERPLVVVADLDSVWVVADLFEADAVDVKVGTPAHVTSPALPATELNGQVQMVSAVVDPDRHTVPIRVQLDNHDHVLKPNEYANVRFESPAREGVVEIPASALVTDGARQSVFVQDSPGHFVRRDIVAGSVVGGKLPVLKGLSAGETVVVEGAILLDNEISIEE